MTLRPQRDGDFEFIFDLYAETRREELQPVPWPEETKRAFLVSQFNAQWAHYSSVYQGGRFLIIERDGTPIGRLYVWDGADNVHIVDIAITGTAQGAGIGTALLREVMDDAARTGRSASIHVERNNRALGLYTRLGFVPVDEHGIYYLMRWSPGPSVDDRPNPPE